MIASRLAVGGPRPETNARWSRYANVTLNKMSVIRAQSAEEFRSVARLRQEGFGRVADESVAIEWVDASDHATGTFSLLALCGTGEPIATLRVQDSRALVLDLAARVPLSSILSPAHWPAAQFSRLSVTKHAEGYEAMFALFKAAWRWSLVNGLHSIVIASPPWARPIYEFMCFEDLGPEGRFSHELAGGAEHVSMRLDVQHAELIWRSHGQPLCSAFVDVMHPRICADERTLEEQT